MSSVDGGQFLAQFSSQLQENGTQEAASDSKTTNDATNLQKEGAAAQEQGEASMDTSQQQQSYYGEWTQEQIQQYYQQYGMDPSAYYGADPYSGYYQDPYAYYASSAQMYGTTPAAASGGAAAMRGFAPGQEPTRSVWVGGLHPDTSEQDLMQSFSSFGMIENIKMLPGKGCAFLKFMELDAAIQAHATMNGVLIHGQPIKMGWGKPDNAPAAVVKEDSGPPPCRNIWLGNVGPEVTEDILRNLFAPYGAIDKIKILTLKGCAFINFVNLESAINARRAMQGHMLGDKPLKINFGKETGPPSSGSSSSASASASAAGSLLTLSPPSFASKEPSVEPPPTEVPPPEDANLQSIIDKLCEFVVRNGATFESNIKEKKKGDPKFAFLESSHPHHGYYQWKLWKTKYPNIDAQVIRDKYSAQQIAQAITQQNLTSPAKLASMAMYGAVPPPAAQVLQSKLANSQMQRSTGLESASPKVPEQIFQLPPNATVDLAELAHHLDNLVPTKESIKMTKSWIMQRTDLAPAIASQMRTRAEQSKIFDQRLNLIYLIHDVLHHTLRSRQPGETSDAFSRAFEPHLSTILTLGYSNQSPEDQEKIMKVFKIWEDKQIYDLPKLRQWEDDMRASDRLLRSDRRDKDDRGRNRDRDYRDRDYRDRSRSRERDRDRSRSRERDRDYDRDYTRKRGRDSDSYDRDYDKYESKRRVGY